ncbi:MAG: PQQ-like beta-propeller repeat protein [Planctomycetales bacterium]|nr:PQQ-like beta-propeller repeat protein [Planctomycetales bacterium]
MIRNLIILFALTVPASAFAAERSSDWHQFRGPDRTGLSSSTNLLTEWPEGGPELVWKAAGAGRGYSSVVFSNGRLVTMGDAPSTAEDKDEYLHCFDNETGKQIWQVRLGKPWAEGPDDWQSSRSTPTIDGSRVYALTAHGDLVCCEMSNGAEVWRKNLKDDFGGKKGDGWGYSESVLIDGDRLICTPGGTENTMVGLNKSNGEPIWSCVREDDRGAGHASIVISNIGETKVYVTTTASGALGVRATDGELMWSYEIDQTTAVIPTPIVRGDLVFFTAGYGRGGALLKQIPAADGKVSMEEVYPLNQDLQNKHGGVVLVGDYLYGDTDSRGMPYCAELMTGDNRWKERGSGKGSASVTYADGHLYIWYSSSATMVLAEATPERYEEISSFTIEDESQRPAWAHPVVFEGKLYLRKDDTIYCYNVSK